ncbi:MAG: cupin domain-containing protein, partial [Betaproteobacteria bacterium]|nr:cupin domain-containing protein [Betaproteobacteria bacterium]
MEKNLLGGLTSREFLRRHWQKRPLYVRNAVPRFIGVLEARKLFTLAQRDDIESRVVVRKAR